VSNKFRALPYVISHFTVLFLDRWGALQVCSVPHLFFAFIRYFSAFVISKYILYNQGVVHCSLYVKYKLTDEEIEIIESVIKDR
jgi:hypothetical protein